MKHPGHPEPMVQVDKLRRETEDENDRDVVQEEIAVGLPHFSGAVMNWTAGEKKTEKCVIKQKKNLSPSGR